MDEFRIIHEINFRTYRKFFTDTKKDGVLRNSVSQIEILQSKFISIIKHDMVNVYSSICLLEHDIGWGISAEASCEQEDCHGWIAHA